MSRAVPQQKIINAALQGVKAVFDTYYQWSGGYWLDYAPESFIQTKIAESLFGLCPYVTLEDVVRDLLEAANADKRGRPPRGNSSGRVDIIVWWKNGAPRALIEVKRAWTYDILTEDAKRLRQLVSKKGGSIKNGLIIAYTDAISPETIARRFEAMAEKSGTKIKANLGPKHPPDEDDGYWWDAACFVV